MNQDEHYYFPDTGYVRAKKCAKFLGIGESTFWLWVKQNRIKKPIKFGSRVSVWDANYIRDLAKNGIQGRGADHE